MINLRKLLVILIVIALITGMYGCAKSNDSSQTATTKTTEQTTTTTKEVKDVTLAFIMAQTSAVLGYYNKIITNYETANPGVKIDLQAIPDDQLQDLVKTKIATGSVPDVWAIHTPVLKLMNTAENFVEFPQDDPWADRLINKNLIDSLKIDGKIYGPVIQGISVGWGYIFSTELFSKYGLNPPESYDELITVCEEFKKNDVTPIFAADKEEWIPQIWFSLMAPQVVPYETFQKIIENKLKWSEVPEFEDAFQKQLDLYTKGYVNEDHLSATYDDLLKAMAENKAAMSFMGNWAIGEIAKIRADANDVIGSGALPCVENPSVAAGGGAATVAVFLKSANKDEGIRFSLFFAEPESHKLIIDENNTASAYIDVQSPENLPKHTVEVYEKYHKTGRTFVDMNSLLPVDFSALWPLEQDMVAGGKTPKQLLEDWDKEFATMMKAKKMPGW